MAHRTGGSGPGQHGADAGGRAGVGQEAGWDELHRMLADPEAVDRLRLLTGNTQISAKELTHLLPLG